MLGGHQEVNDADRSKEVAAFAAKALSSKADVSASGDLEVVEIVSHHSQVRILASFTCRQTARPDHTTDFELIARVSTAVLHFVTAR